MNLNRANLTAVIDVIDEAEASDVVAVDRWPGDGNSSLAVSFVMNMKTERVLRHANSTAVLSSRLPKILDGHQRWFDAIRTIGASISRRNEVMLTAETAAANRFCMRMAALFGICCVTLEIVPMGKLKGRLVQDKNAVSSSAHTIYTVYCVSDEKLQPDHLLGQLADQVYALSIRRNGNVEKSLRCRLLEKDRPPGTFILHEDELTPKALRKPLIDLGAIDWLLLSDDAKDLLAQKFTRTKNRQRLSYVDLNESEYLIHWTRGRSGPWPDQSANEHLDDLIFGANGGQHGDVFSLCRILASQRIIGSSNLTRDTSPVVCFSEVPLSQLRMRKVFRRHLQRWDFLPYGIAIKRKVLEREFGCRPVVYGDEETWESLAVDHRPLFQLAKSTNREIDWQEEREWRVVGDVDLRKIDLSDGVVFVGNENDLEKLSPLSLFDLIVL